MFMNMELGQQEMYCQSYRMCHRTNTAVSDLLERSAYTHGLHSYSCFRRIATRNVWQLNNEAIKMSNRCFFEKPHKKISLITITSLLYFDFNSFENQFIWWRFSIKLVLICTCTLFFLFLIMYYKQHQKILLLFVNMW